MNLKIQRAVVYLFSKVVLLVLFLSISLSAQAQVNLSGPYYQNFDSLHFASAWQNNNTLKGWSVSAANGALTATDGSTNPAGVRSYGVTGQNDCALGHSVSNTYFGVKLKNNTGNNITSLTVTYSIEVWKRGIKNHGTLSAAIAYQKAAASLTSGTWTSPANAAATIVYGGGTKVESGTGNNPDNKASITFVVPVSLNQNEEVTLRWVLPASADYFVGLDDVSVLPNTGAASANIFYSRPNGNGNNGTRYMNDLSSWNSQPNGNGSTPVSFQNAIFIVQGRVSSTINAPWVLGSGAKVIVSEGELIIPNNYTVSGTVDVAGEAVLTINNVVLPTLGTLGPLSTVNVNSATNTIPGVEYGILVVNNGKKNLNAPLKVKNRLTLNSPLELGSHNLEMEASAVIQNTGTSNYIIAKGSGRLKKQVKNNSQPVVFPVGTDTEYLPVTIKQSNSATTDMFSVSIAEGILDPNGSGVRRSSAANEYSIDKTWYIEEAVAGGSDLTVTIDLTNNQVLAAELATGFDVNQAKLVQYTNNIWDYAAASTTVAPTAGGYTLTRTGITSLEPFSIMSKTPAPLPVELLSFAAKRDGNGIVCSWKTAQELNNDYFTVERSSDGREFTEAGTVKGKGTTSQTSVYTFTDQLAPAALTYYRLKQTDLDGTASYSKIVVVSAKANATAGFELYPNPSAGQSVLQSVAEIAEPAAVTILNAQGQVVKNLTVNPSDLQAGVKLDLVSEPAGVYFLQIIAQNQVTNLRMVKQ